MSLSLLGSPRSPGRQATRPQNANDGVPVAFPRSRDGWAGEDPQPEVESAESPMAYFFMSGSWVIVKIRVSGKKPKTLKVTH